MTRTGSTVLSAGAKHAMDLVQEHPNNIVLPDWLAGRLKVEKWQAISILKELAAAGYGAFILGRKGGQTRFEKTQFSSPTFPNEPISQSFEQPALAEDWQVFLLRRANAVQIRVPADITRDEAEKLGKWLMLVASD